jgi:trimeric autotransporter adhesin
MRKIYTLLCAVMLFGYYGKAQSLATYAFANSTTASLTDMSTGTATLLATGTYYDDVASAVTSLPFNFYFMGTAYTQFSINSNAQFRFGAIAILGTNLSTPTAATPILAPITGDNAIKASGRVVSKVTGAVGSQVFTVSWEDLTIPLSTTNPGGVIQVRLYEATGIIEYVYGNVYNGTAANTRAIFLGSSNTATTNGYVTIGATPTFTLAATVTTNTFAAVGSIPNLSSVADGSRIMYTFTPNQIIPANPTTLTFTGVGLSTTTVNWVDNSTDETNFTVFRSTDGGVTYTPVVNVVTTTSGGTGTSYSFAATGLTPGTMYTWKVVANKEGVASVGITGTATTASCSLVGTFSVGPTGTYTSLTAALVALNANGLAGPVILQLQASYVSTVETFPVTINAIPCLSAVNTLTIRPETGATALAITSANTTATIDMNGGNYVTIDGRPGGTGVVKQLTIANTVTAGSAMRFINEASNNTLTYCTVTGVNTSTTGGVIQFSTTTGANGNDNNTISFCDIKDGATTPTNAIYAAGSTTTTATNNSGNVITNNNIYNYFAAASDHYGVNISTGNTDWTITNNSFYQTATRLITTNSTTSGVRISNTSSNNNLINGNYIGGTAPLCAGAAQTYTGSATVGVVFRGLQLTVGTTVATSVQGNVIQNLNITSGSTSTSQSGISLLTGRLNVGNVTGNTVGSQSLTNSIIFVNASTSTALIFTGILAGTGSAELVNISNNTIGGIAVSASSTGSVSLRGIAFQGGTGTFIINNNIVGSLATANSITNATNNAIIGIFGAASITTATQNISNNTIANIAVTSTGTTAQLIGILAQGSTGGIYSTTRNMVRNLSSAAPNTGTSSSASIIGISYTAASTAGQIVSQDTVHTLSNTSTAASSITMAGIYYSGPTTGTNLVARNYIHSLSLSATGPVPIIHGINVNGGTTTFQNNMISIGAGVTGNYGINGINDGLGTNNYFFNSVYIGGTVAASGTLFTYAFNSGVTTSTRIFRNNIFVNERVNTFNVRNYAVQVAGTAANPTGLTINYNDYYVNGTGTALGRFNSIDQLTIAAWRTAVGQDVNSFSANPLYANTLTNDLHLTSGSPAEAAGLAEAGIMDDIDGDLRASFSPTDIGADAGNYLFTGIEMTTTTLVAPAAFGCYTNAETVTVTIKNNSANPIDFSVNNATVSATATGGYSSSVLLTTGVLASGATQNVTMPATIDLTANGAYTFNASVTVVGDVNPANDAMLPVVRNVLTLGGTKTVGVGGDYATITAAATAYNTASCFTGPVLFSLIDATYPSEVYPININANLAAGSNSLTIKPATGVTPSISGSSTTGIFMINAADNIIINGSNGVVVNALCPATTATRDLTITNTSTSTGSAVVYLQSVGADGATNNKVMNCNLVGSGVTQTLFGVGAGGSSISTSSLGTSNNNNNYINNNISAVQYGIYTQGASAAVKNTGTVINQNIINTSANTKGGIWVGFDNGVVISGNNISNIAQAAAPDVFAISCGFGTAIGATTSTGNEVVNATITQNTIGSVVNSGTFSAYGIGVSAATSGTTTIANNMISGVMANGTSGDIAAGIALGGGTGSSTKVYNNTVAMQGTILGGTAATQTSTCLAVTNSTAPTLDVRNNILTNTQIGNTGATLRFATVALAYSTYATLTTNYNSLYCAGAGPGTYTIAITGTVVGGTNSVTFANWQTTTAQEVNSLNVLLNYTSSTDLHIVSATSCAFDAKGVAITGVTNDIDCQTRSTSMPDIGADEFNPVIIASTPISNTGDASTYVLIATTPYMANCRLIAEVTPTGGTPVAGNIAAKTTIVAPAVNVINNEPYGPRVTDLDPTTDGSGTVKLYFKQQDFTDYNSFLTTGSLAYNLVAATSGDVAGAGAVRIREWHGPNAGTGPGTGTDLLTPTSVTWDAAGDNGNGWWVVTVNAPSFSSFFLTSTVIITPVTIASVRGELTGATNTVYWTTTTESDNRKFIVEKSTNGSSFAAIGEVATKAINGNSNIALNYNFVDANPVQGKQYYRLQMVDNGGRITYSPIVTVRRGAGKLEIVDVRPNPTTGTVYFNVLGTSNNINVAVRDLSGKEVIRKGLVQSNNFSLDLSKLATGMYILEAIDVKSNEKAVFKIVKD